MIWPEIVTLQRFIKQPGDANGLGAKALVCNTNLRKVEEPIGSLKIATVRKPNSGMNPTVSTDSTILSRASTRPTKNNEKTRRMENQLLAFSWGGRIIIIPPGY
jgi:hypothetical protein